MARKIALLGLLLATIAFFGAGCCKQKKCENKYGGIFCSDEWQGANCDGPQTPVGPDITLEDDGDPNTSELKWTDQGTTDLVPDASLSVFPSTWPNDPCELRMDFIGTSAAKFKFYTSPTISGPANVVTVSNSDVHIKIEEGLWGRIRWTITDKTVTPNRICRPVPTASFDSLKVPKELGGLSKNTLTEATMGQGIKLELQVHVP